jgi:hypothetical protein
MLLIFGAERSQTAGDRDFFRYRSLVQQSANLAILTTGYSSSDV